jgi:hypothetical protein
MGWRERDETLKRFVEVHPSTPIQWVKATIFDNYKVAARRAKKLRERKRKRLPYVGSVLLNDCGRKNDVYCGWQPQSLLHEVLLTEEILPLWDLPWERGNRVGKYNSDGVMCGMLHVEMDRATEGYDQVEDQMRVYERAQAYNVWFAPTEVRMKGIMRIGTEWSLYSVCGSKVWIDASGNRQTVDQVRRLFHNRSARQ